MNVDKSILSKSSHVTINIVQVKSQAQTKCQVTDSSEQLCHNIMHILIAKQK